MTEPSPQSRHQARVLLARNEDRSKPPRWVTDPRTGIERQAAHLLAEPERPDGQPDKRSASERQAARLLGTDGEG